jgi:hypothetical protein
VTTEAALAEIALGGITGLYRVMRPSVVYDEAQLPSLKTVFLSFVCVPSCYRAVCFYLSCTPHPQSVLLVHGVTISYYTLGKRKFVLKSKRSYLSLILNLHQYKLSCHFKPLKQRTCTPQPAPGVSDVTRSLQPPNNFNIF